jgi:aminomethyltransferase
MKRTAFFEIHKQLGAKIVGFGGFEMPVQYTSILDEHRNVRRNVGIFDVSHMGEVKVSGRDALSFVQRVTVNDVSKLSEGKVQYSAMCYEDGGIVDDLLVYHCGDHFMLVVNASNTLKDFAWMQQHVSGDVRLENISDATSLLAVQGPKSPDTLQPLTSVRLSEMPYYTFVRTKLAGVDMIISRTGYTGEVGFELYFPSDLSASERVWNAIMESGRPHAIQPIGLGARDTLRLEMGFRLYGNDIDQTTNPLEAGLGWITKLDKGDFIGRDVLLDLKKRGLKRKLVGFIVAEERAFPRHGCEIRSDHSSVGIVTSGSISPTLERVIGMGYVTPGLSEIGSALSVIVRDRAVKAEVTKLPFVQK